MIFKKDNLKFGLALGLIGPILGLVVIKLPDVSSFPDQDFRPLKP